MRISGFDERRQECRRGTLRACATSSDRRQGACEFVVPGDCVARVFAVAGAVEKRGINQPGGCWGLRRFGEGFGHRVDVGGHVAAHFDEAWFCKEVAVLFAVQRGELIPEEGDGGERGAQDRVAETNVLFAIDAELVDYGVVEGPQTSDGFGDLIADGVELPEFRFVGQVAFEESEEASFAT